MQINELIMWKFESEKLLYVYVTYHQIIISRELIIFDVVIAKRLPIWKKNGNGMNICNLRTFALRGQTFSPDLKSCSSVNQSLVRWKIRNKINDIWLRNERDTMEWYLRYNLVKIKKLILKANFHLMNKFARSEKKFCSRRKR